MGKDEEKNEFEGVVVDWGRVSLGEFRKVQKALGDLDAQIGLMTKIITAWPWDDQYGEPGDPASYDNLPLPLYERLSLYVVEVKQKQSAAFQQRN